MGINKSGKSKAAPEKKIKKKMPITLLSILCVFMTMLIFITFARFPVGIKNFHGVLGAINLDYDIEGGVAYTLELSNDNLEQISDIDEVVDTFRYRLNELGYQTYSVKAIKSLETGVEDYAIRVEIDNYKTVEKEELDAFRAENDNTIRAVAAYGEVAIYGGTAPSANPKILTEKKAIDSAEFTGSYVNGETTYYLVSISFTDYGYDELMKLIDSAASSSEAGSYYMGIKIGDKEVLTQTIISKSAFDGKDLVIMFPTELTAKQAALQINSGGLKYKFDIEEAISSKVDVTSPYGENVALKCFIMVMVILVLIFLAFGLIYKGFSLITSLSLLLFILLETFMLIAVPGIILSLGGVAGIILSLLLTALCLALTANNIKKEFVSTEKTVKAAVKKGFKDSFLNILNTFIVSGVIALVLFFLTRGAIRGFAITFGIGSIIGLISSVVFSRMFAALILPISEYSEKFFGVKRGEE